jgi:N-acetylglucosaminyldiphosphoundecaprenol N-acetyl-beta-D-mannosaminyltransferase
MPVKERININGINIHKIDYDKLISVIRKAIELNTRTTIAYANANTINLSYRNKQLVEILNSFDMIHPDGIGVYFASRYLYKDSGLKQRFTGSDLYPILAEQAIKNNWSRFFFGHDNDTLSKIKNNLPKLRVSGYHNGYSFNDIEVIGQINSSNCDILIIGLGTPDQENWVFKNKEKLHSKVILCVGEGIKVFAGSKIRGPGFLRKSGLEWLVRLAFNPVKYFDRYVIGNPLFLYRIIRIKMRKLAS